MWIAVKVQATAGELRWWC